MVNGDLQPPPLVDESDAYEKVIGKRDDLTEFKARAAGSCEPDARP